MGDVGDVLRRRLFRRMMRRLCMSFIRWSDAVFCWELKRRRGVSWYEVLAGSFARWPVDHRPWMFSEAESISSGSISVSRPEPCRQCRSELADIATAMARRSSGMPFSSIDPSSADRAPFSRNVFGSRFQTAEAPTVFLNRRNDRSRPKRNA